MRETQPKRTSSIKSTRVHFCATSSITNENIVVFRELFRGRDDVYARRWQSRKGKSGYSPACANEWDSQLCRKPCSQCTNRDYLPLTDQVIHEHLTGKHAVGLYPMFEDETCYLLAVDFDKTTWRADVRAFLATCRTMNISAYLERSRSGAGGHV